MPDDDEYQRTLFYPRQGHLALVKQICRLSDELERLQEIIEKAPHGLACKTRSLIRRGDCDCWKSEYHTRPEEKQ